MEQAADLMGIGQHCSVPSCCQIDFLPFQCDCCQQIFCLEHRTYSAHHCPKAGDKQTEVIVCPICAKGVPLRGRDPNMVFEEHSRSDGCDPANYARVHRKPKCPVKHCKEKLTTINTYHCKKCNQRVCLKHRHESDHSCAEAQVHMSQQRASSWMGRVQQSTQAAGAAMAQAATGRSIGAGPAAPSAPTAAVKARGQAAATSRSQPDPANTVHGTAAYRRQQLQQQQQPRSAGSNANPLVPPHLPEKCPQCGAAFATVERLIQHVEEWHPTQAPTAAGHSSPGLASTLNPAYQGAAPQGGSEAFRCPHCARVFNDAVMLVGHVEQCQAGPGSRRAVVTGPSKPECSIQ